MESLQKGDDIYWVVPYYLFGPALIHGTVLGGGKHMVIYRWDKDQRMDPVRESRFTVERRVSHTSAEAWQKAHDKWSRELEQTQEKVVLLTGLVAKCADKIKEVS